MTPEELDAIEKRYTLTDDAVEWHGESAVWETAAQVPDLIDALRGALAEVERLAADLLVQQRATDDAEAALDSARALLDRVREASGSIIAERNRLRDERDDAEAALDKVRAVIAPRTAHDCPSCGMLAREVEAAIEEECRP